MPLMIAKQRLFSPVVPAGVLEREKEGLPCTERVLVCLAFKVASVVQIHSHTDLVIRDLYPL